MSAPSTADNRLAFAILGPLRVTSAGVSVALGGRQQRAILARLLVAGKTGASVDQLADMLWGERPPNGFATTIQTYVFHLRKALEPERGRGAPGQILLTENGRYRLAIPPDAVDAEQFERATDAGERLLAGGEPAAAAAELRRGLALWRGDVLADLADYDFVAPVAARLREQRQTAVEAEIDCKLSLGRHAAVIGELDQFIAQHPLREQLHQRRMLALYRSGRQSEALTSYDQLRRQLRYELGVDPSAPVQHLHQQMLNHDPALDWHPPPDGDRPATAVAPDPRPRRGRTRRRLIVGCAVAGAAVAGTAAVVVSQTPRSSLRTLPPNSVGRIASDGSLHDAVTVGQNPGGIAYGAGSIWVTNTSDNTVSRINPRTHAVTQTIWVGAQPVGIAVSGDNVWVANSGDSTVSQISALADQTVGDPIQVGNGPSAIAAGASGVWVANSGDDTIQRIDPKTGAAGQAIPVGGGPDGLAVDAHTVWIANERTASLSRLDTDSRSLVSDEILVGAGPAGVAVTQPDVWVANQGEATVDWIDRASGNQSGSIAVGQGPSSILATTSMIWVANEFDGTVTQIDPGTGQRRRTISIGAIPAGLAVVDGTVWVATRAFAGAGHRGGILTVLGPDIATDPSIDPNDHYSIPFAPAKFAAYDGLVAFRPVGGAAGLTLVPDLVIRIPRPTDGGRTYAFTLRKGIRYSNGSYVQAFDFRRSVERALVLPNGNPRMFASIVGAQACIDRPAKPCDLSEGIETDDGRVIFHLVAADPQFLYKLALFVFAIPPTAPRAKELKVPPPGTGPYQVVDYVKNKGYALVRNPYFHQWSFAAQPSGYPDTIQWRRSSSQQAVNRVLNEAGDVVDIGSPDFGARTGQVIEDLHRQHPTQLHSDPWLQTDMEQLNTRLPPFNNEFARQAVNYATDRNELVNRFGGPLMATPTCQLLPPNFPGYKYNCPFDAPGPDGRYAGPDLAKAKALVARSGTLGVPVTVDVLTDSRSGPITSYFAELLPTLGYRVTVRKKDPSKIDARSFYSDPRNKMQIAWANGWIADYPAPDNFYRPLFSCAGFLPANPLNNNISEFCNDDIDELAKQARILDVTDPSAAHALWRQIDQKVTEASPAIFTVTRRVNTLISRSVGNYTRTLLGILVFDQMWVQ